MSDAAARLRRAVIERAVDGAGVMAPEARRAAFENRGVDERVRALVDRVARNAWKVTAADVQAAARAGASDDEIFELTICAALGQATRQLERALAALDEAGSGTERT